MKYLSLFSGIGGFELGITQAYEIRNANRGQERGVQEDTKGDKGQGLLSEEGKDTNAEERPVSERTTDQSDERPLCVGYSEIDKYAVQIYQKHFPEHKNYGDITKINPAHLPDFDALFAGFPCQSFSIAGKRRGFEDTRGTMFFEIARILKEKQPRLFLLENVKGLLSHDNGNTFRTIITSLDELGYDMEWQVLNSKNFGVPQNRERVFIVGHLRGTSRPQVFPIGAEHEVDIAKTTNANTLTANYWKGAAASRPMVGELRELTTNASQAGGVGAKTGLYEVEDMKIRRLTPTECERLQGFPDGWTEYGVSKDLSKKSQEKMKKNGLTAYVILPSETKMSDTQRYKTLGNAVTVNVIKAIVEKML